jgi:hypothetical protein
MEVHVFEHAGCDEKTQRFVPKIKCFEIIDPGIDKKGSFLMSR